MTAALRDLTRLRTAVQTPADDDGRVVLERGSDLKPEPVRWLWKGWLARGKLHILAGEPGQGKTTIALAIMATVTRGGRWPDGSKCEPGNALIWSGEDDARDTLLPRLLAMGADTSRVHFVRGARVDGELVPFNPARDLIDLAAAAERIGGARLLVVDPVVSVVGGVDSHKNTEVRTALQPVVDLAAALDAAALGISHFGKGTAGRNPTERVVGSVAFAAVARVVLVAAKVRTEDGKHRHVLARSKSNIGPDEGGFEYYIEQDELEQYPGVIASRIDWGGAIEGTARELLAEHDDGDEREAPARDVAGDFLRQVLGGDAVPSKTVEAEAKAAGVSWRTVRRAADELGVIKRKAGMDGGWYWSMPMMAKKGPNMSNPPEWPPSASSVATFDTGGRDDASASSGGGGADDVADDAEVFE